MTDSMKFGPEWLRNMSTDSSSVGLNTGSGTNNATNNSAINLNNSSGIYNNVISTTQGTVKNLFPEFRYGREEMLSLFDKNYNMPEILPTYKKIFIEKVQYPLALIPTSDEEMTTHGNAAPMQRPVWLQRSPVGFSSSIRNVVRGSTADRGRMRGKSIYHPIYQRPTAMLEEDLRAHSSKSERNWTERNGINETQSISSGTTNFGPDWNCTPATSPRKEYSAHSRNMENWRKNRNEDALDTNNTNSDGWRGGNISNSFGSSHRWGRSTSWREEENTSSNVDISHNSSGNTSMQRSFSTIATFSEKNSLKNVQNSCNASNIYRVSANTSTSVARNKQWKNSSEGHHCGAGDTEDNLPEWAIESPSDSGGTFDASGAFHGSVLEDDLTASNKDKKSEISTNTENILKKENIAEKNGYFTSKDEVILEKLNVHNMNDSNCSIDNNKNESKLYKHSKDSNDIETDKDNSKPKNSLSDFNSDASTLQNSLQNTDVNNLSSESLITPQKSSNNDYSDHMKEVADDMVEKLIMEDDINEPNVNTCVEKKENTDNLVSTTDVNIHNSFISPAVAAILKQTTQHDIQQMDPLSSTLNSIVSSSSNAIYRGGMVGDQFTLPQNLNQQEITIPTVASTTLSGLPHSINSASSMDLWYYRDPQSKVQGPFTAVEMSEWYRAGYFNENLYVRRVCDASFRTLGELIKHCHGNMPFSNSHLISVNGLESIPNASSTPISPIPEKPKVVDHREELKSQVTATANSLSAAVKSLISSVDVGHILSMHFQMLQQQYIRHHEMIIHNELSKNDCFQRLTPSEKESIIQQKVHMIELPEYLISLSGLSNSLAALNPSAGNQLFDAIAECSKKGQIYLGGNQQVNINPINNTYMDSNNYILNNQSQNEHMQFSRVQFTDFTAGNEQKNCKNVQNNSETDLINDMNLRILLQSGGVNLQQKSQNYVVNSNPNDFLTEQQLLASAASTQGPMLQMWLPQSNILNTTLQSDLLMQQNSHPQKNQWSTGPLVGIPRSVMLATSLDNKNSTLDKNLTNIWDVLHIKQNENELQIESDKDKKKENLIKHSSQKEQIISDAKLPLVEIMNESHILSASSSSLNKLDTTQLSNPIKQKKEECTEKPQNLKKNKQQLISTNNASSKLKDAITNKKTEDDKRKEIADEKRRQKEEKKRQQVEEEKRRLLLLEEEKRRQSLEEKERQLQIQTQRRKALLGNTVSTTVVTTTTTATTIANNRNIKDQQRIQSSVAPWSIQTNVSGQTGPCLAEIQKAERRERRADQQRQLELIEKQMRANAVAAAEVIDGTNKWNSFPIPVKSFAEIQAEEAKRLSEEQLEIQRRKDQNQHSVILSTPNSGINASSTSVGAGNSASWSGTKVWGSNSNTAGFWEEPIKYNGSSLSNNGTAASIIASNSSTTMQQKKIGSQLISLPKGLKKSQTVTVMQQCEQNASGKVSKAITPQLQPPDTITGTKQSDKNQQKSETERKGNAKKTTPNINKIDDFENEFTNWCIKSLNNMNTKVDVPTFVTFLQDLESPYEVKDYVRLYLGESKECTEFAKQFLERRSKYKNMQRAQNAHNDDLCKPAPAITPLGNDNADNKSKQKRVKKNKMTKLDARILGFSVTAAEGRINVGDRDYVDAP